LAASSSVSITPTKIYYGIHSSANVVGTRVDTDTEEKKYSFLKGLKISVMLATMV